jgi:hypothetical protein
MSDDRISSLCLSLGNLSLIVTAANPSASASTEEAPAPPPSTSSRPTSSESPFCIPTPTRFITGATWVQRLTAAQEAGEAAKLRLAGSQSRGAWARCPSAPGAGKNYYYVVLQGTARTARHWPVVVTSLQRQSQLVADSGCVFHAWHTVEEANCYSVAAGVGFLPIY